MTVLFPASLMAQDVEFSASGEVKSEKKPLVELLGDRGSGSEKVDVPAETSPPPDAAASIPESFDGKLDYGHTLYLKQDYNGALNLYNIAKEMKTNDPLVLYFIACVQVRLNHLEEAMAALTAMKTLSGEKLPSLTAKALFMIAMIEEMRLDDERAIAAWTEYKTYLEGHDQLPGFVGTADARVAAIEKKRDQYKHYEIVRERISASK
jgi:hypothetical protein